ncbi:hypothetical protein EW145_g6725 [Phellinidium pouzarii]|uniref:Protein kinase domain-containing protein n=1 Tax=Phellinidium pouzarii TaxID=167371 RepID=A0A4S4KWV9_9AGAM|nr:hypothetical protein EW145_g6725 [Phellinidium pouzarii]
MDGQTKSSSRFSTLNVFGKFSASPKPPRPPPKDQWYRQGSKSTVSLAPSHALSTHAASIASSSHDTLQIPPTPISIASRSHYNLSRTTSPASTRSRATAGSTATPRTSETGSFFSKLSNSFGKRPKLFLRSNASRTTLSPVDNVSDDGVLVSSQDADDDISTPWNFQHHLHVDEGLTGLPPEWVNQLRASGLKDTDIISTHSRRNRTTYLQNHPDVSLDILRPRPPYSPSVSSVSSSLLSPSSASPQPQRSVPLRRSMMNDDASTMRSTSSGSRSTDSPPSLNYDDMCRPSLSSASVSSRSPSSNSPPPSIYSSQECPGTATAANFTTSRPARPDRPLPREASVCDGDPPSLPSTPPTRTTTFRVMNASPPSPPPAYGSPDLVRANVEAFTDMKVRPSVSSRSSREECERNSDMLVERRSEETVTPEVFSREDSQASGYNTQTAFSQSLITSPISRLHLSAISRSDSPSPPASPIPRATVLPPRLSLHQDMDSDLSSWSEQLFSVMNTSDPKINAGSSAFLPVVSTSVPAKASPTTPKKSPVPPLMLSPPSEDNSVIIEVEQDQPADFSSTPLFEEVMSLVQSSYSIETPTLPTSTYPYLPSPPAASSAFPQSNYDFLSESYDIRCDSNLSQPSSRDSQATISASSRWSRATTVRDVRDATIGHVRKTSVANAMTVLAPSKHGVQPNANTARSGPSLSSADRLLSTASCDAEAFPSVDDFPMPPPSPNDAAFSISSAQPSPLSPSFSVESARMSVENITLPYDVDRASAASATINRLPSPASTRSSQSSSGSGSTSCSSQVNPLSTTSSSEEGHEECEAAEGKADAVRVELRYIESEGSLLSPTDSEASTSKWAESQTQPARIDITASTYDQDPDDGASAVVDWLTDTPSPHYELHGSTRRDSVTVYNPRGEPLLHPSAATDSPSQARRPSLQTNGLTSPGSDGETGLQKFLSPSLAVESLSSPSSAGTSPSSSSSVPRYRGWVSEVVAPLEEFIDNSIDPRQLFVDMREIAEGESGSVFVATVVARPPKATARGCKSVKTEDVVGENVSKKVAIKNVPLLPGGSPKLEDLRKELLLMSNIRHENILSMDGLYVDLVEDSLWIKMELMERSLADMLALAEEGFTLPEEAIARFASDILNALVHLEDLGIAHRDVRSDNLLVSSQGILKLTDFSRALLVDSSYPMHTDPVGVVYWQAPEMRSGSYDARKVDVWSAGATTWEMAESSPPFMDIADPQRLPDRWPTLSQPDIYSPSLYDFLTLCSSPSSSRRTAHDLLTCTSIEVRIHRRQSGDFQGTILS